MFHLQHDQGLQPRLFVLAVRIYNHKPPPRGDRYVGVWPLFPPAANQVFFGGRQNLPAFDKGCLTIRLQREDPEAMACVAQRIIQLVHGILFCRSRGRAAGFDRKGMVVKGGFSRVSISENLSVVLSRQHAGHWPPA